ncbi:late embryogenesis abundant protein D-34-like [Oryza glaberrima]|uniref:late embryogenesis abundant protein D-34-like n=1 Tax=Oryza glaberrima TaxID=4538 RepID=UPI00224BFCA6|nr:late embryogenesis abundant protein D-34-like [Oryza glaberrima]
MSQQGIWYGDVFPVTRSLAAKPIAPRDAATCSRRAENLVLGKTVKGGPAAAMESAASRNEEMGVIGHDQSTDATAEHGVNVSNTLVLGGSRIVTEFVAGQVITLLHEHSSSLPSLRLFEQDDGAATLRLPQP